MKTTMEWVNAAKAALKIESDYALAAALGLSRSCISNYRTGRSFIDDDVAQKIAATLGVDVGVILASVAAERAKRPEIKTAWERLAKLAAGTLGALIFSVFSLFGGTAGTAEAGQKIEPVIYIMRNRQRRLRLALAALLLLGSSTAAASDWSRFDIERQVAYTVLHVIDWGQTLYIAEFRTEGNPILGQNPSRGEVNAYFATTLGLHFLAVHLMPTEWRPYFQTGTIVLQIYAVGYNTMVGVKVGF